MFSNTNYPGVTGVKSVDYPTVDDILSNEVLKSGGRLKQKKQLISGQLSPKK